jgi:hypothetical protein
MAENGQHLDDQLSLVSDCGRISGKQDLIPRSACKVRVLSKFALRAYGSGELALLPVIISRSTRCEGNHLLCSVITSARGRTLMA